MCVCVTWQVSGATIEDIADMRKDEEERVRQEAGVDISSVISDKKSI